MADELKPGTHPAGGDGAPAPAGADAGGGGGEGAAPDLNAQVAQAVDAAFQRFLSHFAVEPPGGQSPPTPDPGRAQRDDETQQLEVEIAALANSKDPLARMLLVEKEKRLEERQLYGNALAALNEKIEKLGMPEDDRKDFDAFLKANRHRFADFEAAKMAWTGQRLSNGGAPPPKPAAPAGQPAGRPRLVADVDAHARPVPAREAAERIMSEEQFDDAVAELHRTGDHEGARRMESDYARGNIVLKASTAAER